MVSVNSSPRSATASKMVYRFVVASYTDALHTLAFDPSKPADSALAHISSTTVGRHPSWVEGHPSDRTLLFTGLEQTDGQLLVLRYDPESGEGKVIEKVASGGSDPAHIFVDENQVLVGNVSGLLNLLATPLNCFSSIPQGL